MTNKTKKVIEETFVVLGGIFLILLLVSYFIDTNGYFLNSRTYFLIFFGGNVIFNAFIRKNKN
jgi:hypothetical protein